MVWVVVIVFACVCGTCFSSTEVSSFSWQKDSSLTDYISTSGYRSSRHVRSRYDCGWDCYADDSCMAFFYNQNTALCVTEGTIRQSTSGLSFMLGTSYYALTADQMAEKLCAPQYSEDFQLISLSDGTFLKIRVFRDPKLSWHNAQTECANHGATLFRPSSAIRQAFIQDLLQCDGMTIRYWIDGQKDNANSPWTTWDHSITYTTTYWNSPNPDGPSTELCMEYQPNGGWNDKDCSFTEAGLCEKPA